MVLPFFGGGVIERGLNFAAREIRRCIYARCCDKRTITTSRRVILAPPPKVGERTPVQSNTKDAFRGQI